MSHSLKTLIYWIERGRGRKRERTCPVHGLNALTRPTCGRERWSEKASTNKVLLSANLVLVCLSILSNIPTLSVALSPKPIKEFNL